MKVSNAKGLLALSPLAVFLCLYLVTSIVVGDFYKMSLTVAFAAAAAYAVAVTGGMSLADRISLFSKGAADSNIMLMVWIFMMAGAFAQAATDMGCIHATVSLSLSMLPDNLIPAGLFVGACFISLSIGTSVGTIVALVPVAAGIAEATGASAAFMTAIVVGGAFFGDNLSFISDTTIAATRTQGCAMADKFKANLRIVMPAASIVFVIYMFCGLDSVPADVVDRNIDFVKVLPYVVVLATALAGVNVLLVLLLGILSTGVIGLSTDSCGGIFGWVGSLGQGILSMGELIAVTLLAGGLLHLIRHNGGIDYLLQILTRGIRGHRGAELSIAALVSLANVCTANNTIAIITVGPIAADISRRYGVDPRRSASLLDTFSCVVQGVLPYGAQLLMASTLAMLSPLDIITYLYYPMAVVVFALLSIVVSRPYVASVLLMALVVTGCGRPQTGQLDKPLTGIIPASSSRVVHADLEAWLKAAGCQWRDGAAVPTADMQALLDADPDCKLYRVIASMGSWGRYADLTDVYIVNGNMLGAVGLAPVNAANPIPADLRSKTVDDSHLGHISVYDADKAVEVGVWGDVMCFATKQNGGAAKALATMTAAAADSALADRPYILDYLSGGDPADIHIYYNSDGRYNLFGDSYSMMFATASCTDRTLAVKVTWATDSGKPVQALSRLSTVDPGFARQMPAGAVAYAAAAAGPDIMDGLQQKLAGRYTGLSGKMVRKALDALTNLSGTYAVGVAPGGASESLRGPLFENWLVRAIVPVDLDGQFLLNKLIDSKIGGRMMRQPGEDGCTILQNYQSDLYPEGIATPAISPGTTIVADLTIPFGSEVMKALGLERGFDVSIRGDVSTITSAVRVLGPGYILPALVDALVCLEQINDKKK